MPIYPGDAEIAYGSVLSTNVGRRKEAELIFVDMKIDVAILLANLIRWDKTDKNLRLVAAIVLKNVIIKNNIRMHRAV